MEKKRSGEEPLDLETPFGHVFQDSRGMYMVNKARPAEKTMITVTADTYPAAYELALISVWKHGKEIRTHYDQKAGGEYLFPPSREASVMVDIKNPLQEPRVHRFLPGGFDQLESYRQEVVEGHRDACIAPNEKKWTYTYHERFFNWNPSTDLHGENRGMLLEQGVNQIEKVVYDLKRDLTSKGSQVTTWMPTADPGLESNRPCLQRMWFRAYEDGDEVVLNTDWEFRSRDTTAWFMNGWALTDLARYTADGLSEEIDRQVRLGRISDFSNSLHFYGHNQAEFESRFKFLQSDEGFEKRIVSSDNETVNAVILEEREKLRVNPHYKSSKDSQRDLAEKIAADPHATERDKKFVRDFFPTTAKGAKSWLLGHDQIMDGETV